MSFQLQPQPSSSRVPSSNTPSTKPHPSSTTFPSQQPQPQSDSDQQHSTTPPLPNHHYQFNHSSQTQTPILPLPPSRNSSVKKTNHVKTIMTSKSTTTANPTTSLAVHKQLGRTILPVTRVTRAAKQDKDIKIVSKEAVFLISVATEFFVRKLTNSAFFNAKLDKRVFVKYNDVAKAVQMNDEYMWLDDVIPISRPLISVLNDPSIPSSSTSLTNQMPQLVPQTTAPLPNTTTPPTTVLHSSQVVNGDLPTESAVVTVAAPVAAVATDPEHEMMETLEADEDELDEDL